MHALEPLLGDNHRFMTRGRCDSLPVLGDRARIATMVLNLIDNAIKYSPDGGDIEIGWSRRSGVGHVSVTDHGVGISREQQSMLFTRFGRLVTPATSNIRGTGLGLYLAREIARLHGGDIVVASDRGRGTTFTVSPPCSQFLPDRPGATPVSDARDAGPRTYGRVHLVATAESARAPRRPEDERDEDRESACGHEDPPNQVDVHPAGADMHREGEDCANCGKDDSDTDTHVSDLLLMCC
jgi:hypothetical protein